MKPHVVVVRGALPRGIVETDAGVYRNSLVRNYWASMVSLLLDVNVQYKDYNGSAIAINYAAVNPNAAAELRWGLGLDEVVFNQHSLVEDKGALSHTKTFEVVNQPEPHSRIVFSSTAAADIKEIGVRQRFSGRYILLTRLRQDIPAGSSIAYKLEYPYPWTANFALLWYAKLSKSNPTGAKDVGGNERSIRGAGDSVATQARIVVSETDASWSPEAHTVPDGVELGGLQRAYWVSDSYVGLILVAGMTPSEDYQVRTIGIVERLFDGGGQQYDALVAMITLDQPITLKAGRFNPLMIYLMGY